MDYGTIYQLSFWTVKLPRGKFQMRELCGSEYLTQNIVRWHIDYFKLKEFKKWQVREGLSDLFPPEAGHKIHM